MNARAFVSQHSYVARLHVAFFCQFFSRNGFYSCRNIANGPAGSCGCYHYFIFVFFCFFYTALVFNSKETADNLKKSGAFVPGIRPGDQTARYIDKILMRLTLAGAVYITLVCLLPEFLIARWKVPFYFGGTSLLIIVVVTMDFMAQVQNYVMSQQYESLLRKANFKGGMPTR